MQQPILGLILLVILLALDAFLAASEAALTNAHRHLLRERAEKGDRAAQRAFEVAEDSTRVLSTFQLAILLTHFLIGGVVLALLALVPTPLEDWFPALDPLGVIVSNAIELVVAAVIVYIVAELIPGTLAQRDAEVWSIALAGPSRLVIGLFWPLALLMARLRRAIAAPRPGDPDGALVTEAEIMTQIDAAEEEGAIEAEEKEMLLSIFALDETVAREIMLPRIDIMALDIQTPLKEAIQLIHEAGHSRIPLYEESLDHIVGLVYAKDLITLNDKDIATRGLRSLMRPTYFVPETKKVLDLLRELRQRKVHMAVVVDEYGGTAGLVTIENIVEEIVGDIRDEYDAAEESLFEKITDSEYVVDARMSLDDLNDLLDVELPSEDADTLGGLIYERLGKVPAAGETVRTDDLRLDVLSVTENRIGKVRVRRLDASADPSARKDETTHATPQD